MYLNILVFYLNSKYKSKQGELYVKKIFIRFNQAFKFLVFKKMCSIFIKIQDVKKKFLDDNIFI